MPSDERLTSRGLRYREYGAARRPNVVLVHGGPAAWGYLEPVAVRLGTAYRVLEPFQRGSQAGRRLSVDRHVRDLREFVHEICAGAETALVGHSWGAMLVLAFAAAFPADAGPLALIGCGTFDPASRAQLRQTLEQRFTAPIRAQLEHIERTEADPDDRLAAMGRVIQPAYGYDLDPTPGGDAICDAQAHEQSWQDMLRLQADGVYPAAFAHIASPVLMLHGVADPHPGAMIRESLLPFLPHLEYSELAQCGHSPWLERHAANEFYRVLLAWLGERLGASRPA